ncbi:LPS-assembly protein LptD [Afifella sp. IM 167]|uniref:LPS-assembly protein LptD n=1 Tax=Afifella sp. IM 167 TaxID=2033586 RepID=UPI001CC9F09B|nr:LPS-assembly protein LptD [Afifella sp. IM 167]
MTPVRWNILATPRRASLRVARQLSFARAAAPVLVFVLAFVLALGPAALGPAPARAQDLDLRSRAASEDPDSRMLVEADQLVYDFDERTVSAVGNVEIFYNGYTLVADRVTYREPSGRLLASGHVRMTEPDGNIVHAEDIDITDDFGEGFIESVNVETTDRARFAANSAERREGNVTVFRQGVYTACEPCKDNPERPPLWQVKASKIIHNKQEQTVYYRNARLEFFGVPVAYSPYFFHPDPTVKRKSGFLTPSFRNSSVLGYGVTTPYFWNLAPNYDITFSPTVLSKQGLLAEGEWRHRLMNGAYNVRLAGIFQLDPDAFEPDRSGDRDFRGSITTSGAFAINSQWSWGWNLVGTTDRTFGREYKIKGLTEDDVVNTLYLNGFSERNWFDLRGYAFRVQREDPYVSPDKDGIDYQAEQAVVHPVLDHNYIFDHRILGGEISVNNNVTSLTRTDSDYLTTPTGITYFAGVEGTFSRASTDVTWQRNVIGPLGQVFTPFAYLKADIYDVQSQDPQLGSGSYTRAMPAVGLEYRWPFLATSRGITQTISPVAQIIARPNEQHIEDLPNEDAQSLVFDDTILFSRDKFSGYDRQEGGTRANIGFTYQALFSNGASVDAMFGQSFQLAGTNSFAVRDAGLTGVGSGLESDRSDYVGRVSLDTGQGLRMTARGRFDKDDLSLDRAEATASYSNGRNSGSLTYLYRTEVPLLGLGEQEEISAATQVAVSRYWSVLGGITFDIDKQARVKHALGLAYDDECFNLSAVYSETRDAYTDLVSGRQVFVRFNLRTLGESQVSVDDATSETNSSSNQNWF